MPSAVERHAQLCQSHPPMIEWPRVFTTNALFRFIIVHTRQITTFVVHLQQKRTRWKLRTRDGFKKSLSAKEFAEKSGTFAFYCGPPGLPRRVCNKDMPSLRRSLLNYAHLKAFFFIHFRQEIKTRPPRNISNEVNLTPMN